MTTVTEAFTSLKSLFDLTGRTVVITGGAGWLGTCLTEAIAEQGARTYIASRDKEKRDEVISRIQQLVPSADIRGVDIDIADRSSIDACFAGIAEENGGKIDVLINNAYAGRRKSIEEVNEEDWAFTIDMGLTGYLRCIQAALPYLKESGRGNIINVSSMYGMVAPYPELYEGNDFLNPPAYGAAKAAVLQLSRYSAVHLSKYNVRVNSLSPGPFPSPAVQQDKTFIERLSAKSPLKRTGQPHELKGAIAYLASDASSFVTGQNIVVDGGWTAQ
ncbi:MAG: SDR family oxidoreductase [Candidatus Obscuribacterales bacterium]